MICANQYLFWLFHRPPTCHTAALPWYIAIPGHPPHSALLHCSSMCLLRSICFAVWPQYLGPGRVISRQSSTGNVHVGVMTSKDPFALPCVVSAALRMVTCKSERPLYSNWSFGVCNFTNRQFAIGVSAHVTWSWGLSHSHWAPWICRSFLKAMGTWLVTMLGFLAYKLSKCVWSITAQLISAMNAFSVRVSSTFRLVLLIIDSLRLAHAFSSGHLIEKFNMQLSKGWFAVSMCVFSPTLPFEFELRRVPL